MAGRQKRSAPRFGVYRPTEVDAFHFEGAGRPSPKAGLRLASWNIHFGAGSTLDDARRFERPHVLEQLERIAQAVNDAEVDVLCLQEVDRDSQRSGHVDQLDWLREQTGLRHASFATTWDAAWVPYPVTAPPKQQYGRMWSGQAVLSRHPITEQRRHALSQPSRFGWVYNRFYLHRCVQEVVLDVGGRPLTVFNVHLEAFDMGNRRGQARALAKLLGRTRGHGVCLGDLNTTPPEAAHRHAFPDEPETDFRGDDTLPVLRATGWREVGDGAFTFPAESPTRRLDHALVSPDLGVEVSVLEEPGPPASDHLGLLCELSWPDDAESAAC